MSNVLAWDVDRFADVIAVVDRCLQTLQEQRSEVLKLKGQAQDQWQSDAGREYGLRMDEDLEDLENMIRKFEKIIENLKESQDIFEQGESDLNGKLSSVYAKIGM